MLPPIAKLLSEVDATDSDEELASLATMEHAILAYQSSDKKKCWKKIKKHLMREKGESKSTKKIATERIEPYTKKMLKIEESQLTTLDIPGIHISDGRLNTDYNLTDGTVTTVLWDSESIVFPEIGIGAPVDTHSANIILGSMKYIANLYSLSHNIPESVLVSVVNTKISVIPEASLLTLLESDPFSLKVLNPSMSFKNLMGEYLPLLSIYKNEGCGGLLNHYRITKLENNITNTDIEGSPVSIVGETSIVTENSIMSSEEEFSTGQRVEIRTGSHWTEAVIFEINEPIFSVRVGDVIWESINKDNIRGVPQDLPKYSVNDTIDFTLSDSGNWITGTIKDISSTAETYFYNISKEASDLVTIKEDYLREHKPPPKGKFSCGEIVDFYNEYCDTARWVCGTVKSLKYDFQKQLLSYEIMSSDVITEIEESLVDNHQIFNPGSDVEVDTTTGWESASIIRFSRRKKLYNVILSDKTSWDSIPQWQLRNVIETVHSEQQLLCLNTNSLVTHIEGIPMQDARSCWKKVLKSLPLNVTINGTHGVGRYRSIDEFKQHELHEGISCIVKKIIIRSTDRTQIDGIVLRRSKKKGTWKNDDYVLSNASGWWILYEGNPVDNVCEMRSKRNFESLPSQDPYDSDISWRCSSDHRYLSDWMHSPNTIILCHTLIVTKPLKTLLSLSFKSPSCLKVTSSPPELYHLHNRTILYVNGVSVKTVQHFRQHIHYRELVLTLK